jgi:hypothetical protein
MSENLNPDCPIACKDCIYLRIQSGARDRRRPMWYDLMCTHPSTIEKHFDAYNGEHFETYTHVRNVNKHGHCLFFSERQKEEAWAKRC